MRDRDAPSLLTSERLDESSRPPKQCQMILVLLSLGLRCRLLGCGRSEDTGHSWEVVLVGLTTHALLSTLEELEKSGKGRSRP